MNMTSYYDVTHNAHQIQMTPWHMPLNETPPRNNIFCVRHGPELTKRVKVMTLGITAIELTHLSRFTLL